VHLKRVVMKFGTRGYTKNSHSKGYYRQFAYNKWCLLCCTRHDVTIQNSYHPFYCNCYTELSTV